MAFAVRFSFLISIAPGSGAVGSPGICADDSPIKPQSAARLPVSGAIAARTVPRADDLWKMTNPATVRPCPAATFRTLCVRLCAGFISRSAFRRRGRASNVDADRCQAKAGPVRSSSSTPTRRGRGLGAFIHRIAV